MQKNIILVAIALLAATFSLHAQITVTNATFPGAGDTLRIATDFNPDGIMVTASGGPFTWDYTSLVPSDRQIIIFQEAANGSAVSDFPGADLVIIGEGGAETYYSITPNVLANLGISGSDIGGGFPFATALVFTPPLAERHAPLTFPNVFSTQTAFGFALATSDIPGGILDSLGVGGGFLDSIRLRVTIGRSDFVDAFGNLSIPGGTYEVLRQKRTDITDTRIEIHIPFLGWQDVTEIIPLDGFGQDTLVTYEFYSNTAKEPIAVLTMDSTGLVVEQVDYKDNGIPSHVGSIADQASDVMVFPNPVRTEANFDIIDWTAGEYTVHLFAPTGQHILQQKFTANRVTIPMISQSEGVYFYHIIDEKGRVITRGSLFKSNH